MSVNRCSASFSYCQAKDTILYQPFKFPVDLSLAVSPKRLVFGDTFQSFLLGFVLLFKASTGWELCIRSQLRTLAGPGPTLQSWDCRRGFSGTTITSTSPGERKEEHFRFSHILYMQTFLPAFYLYSSSSQKLIEVKQKQVSFMSIEMTMLFKPPILLGDFFVLSFGLDI